MSRSNYPASRDEAVTQDGLCCAAVLFIPLLEARTQEAGSPRVYPSIDAYLRAGYGGSRRVKMMYEACLWPASGYVSRDYADVAWDSVVMIDGKRPL